MVDRFGQPPITREQRRAERLREGHEAGGAPGPEAEGGRYFFLSDPVPIFTVGGAAAIVFGFSFFGFLASLFPRT